jgi:flagellin
MSGLMISVNTNPMQMKAIAQLTRMSAAMNTSMQRLATGSRINRASDDPAGMIVVEGMKADEKALQAQIESLDREEYRMGAREGAASVVSDQVSELNALVVAAANTGGTSKEEREAMQIEADSILQAIDYISNTTTFNGEQVINGYTARAMGHITDSGADGQSVSYSLADLAKGGRLNLIDGNMDLAQQSVQAAVSGMASERGAMGAYLKGNDAKRATLVTQLEELTKAKSQIADTDFAKETAEMVRAKVLAQVATFVSSLAGDQNASTVLSLVSGAAGAQKL